MKKENVVVTEEEVLEGTVEETETEKTGFFSKPVNFVKKHKVGFIVGTAAVTTLVVLGKVFGAKVDVDDVVDSEDLLDTVIETEM